MDNGPQPHEIAVKGGEGQLVVRAIAEIISYCPCVKCPVNEGPCYDWPYEERYVLPAITTQNGGIIPTNALPSFLARGYRWIANLNTTGLSSNALERALAGCAGLTAPSYAGVTCDEQFFYKPHEIAAYTKGFYDNFLKVGFSESLARDMIVTMVGNMTAKASMK